MRALYIRPRSAAHAEKRKASAHLERMLWSYNRDFALEWTVSYGLPADSLPAPLFEVAFVDEDALPPRLAPGGLSSAMLGAKRLVVVRRAHDPAPAAAPCAEPSCVEVSRPLPFEAFCSLCAQLLDPSLVPCPERFEYHTRDMLHDIWGEGTTQDKAVPRPVFVATTAAACAKRKRVDLAENRETRRYDALKTQVAAHHPDDRAAHFFRNLDRNSVDAFSTNSDASTFAEPCTDDSPTAPPSTGELNEAWGRLVGRVATPFGDPGLLSVGMFASALATSVAADGSSDHCSQRVIGRLADEPSQSCCASWISSNGDSDQLSHTEIRMRLHVPRIY
jgi:hypothetical protein